MFSVIWVYWVAIPLLIADLLYLLGVAIAYCFMVAVPKRRLRQRERTRLAALASRRDARAAPAIADAAGPVALEPGALPVPDVGESSARPPIPVNPRARRRRAHRVAG